MTLPGLAPRMTDTVQTAAAEATAAAADVPAALALARRLGREAPYPGRGTSALWSLLATLGAADLTVARAVEPHLDALAILAQADDPVEDAAAHTWGVFAAEGPGEPVRAERDGDGWRLSGTKPWCSLAGSLDRALVTAVVAGSGERGLFAVDLHHEGAQARPGSWVARGLAGIDSGPLELTAVPATPVGDPGWYLRRPGFAWGGIGVAAVWYGGAVGLARRLAAGRPGRSGPDQVAHLHLGSADAALHAARCVLADAADGIDRGELVGDSAMTAMLRVRHVVATAAEEVLTRAGHALGPGPLALEEEHARRTADLELYLRQWHAERDAAALGERLAADEDARGW